MSKVARSESKSISVAPASLDTEDDSIVVSPVAGRVSADQRHVLADGAAASVAPASRVQASSSSSRSLRLSKDLEKKQDSVSAVNSSSSSSSSAAAASCSDIQDIKDVLRMLAHHTVGAAARTVASSADAQRSATAAIAVPRPPRYSEAAIASATQMLRDANIPLTDTNLEQALMAMVDSNAVASPVVGKVDPGLGDEEPGDDDDTVCQGCRELEERVDLLEQALHRAGFLELEGEERTSTPPLGVSTRAESMEDQEEDQSVPTLS